MDAPENRVLLRQERERAIALLTQRFTEDLLDADELEERMDRAQRAETLAALRALTADLVDPAAGAGGGAAMVPARATSPAVRSAAALAPAGEVRDHARAVALFGEIKHTGRWTPPRILTSFTAFGNTELDFRDAQLGPGVTEIELQAFLGDVDIIVPPGLPVEVSCSAILASLASDDDLGQAPVDAHTPRLRITGFALLADVEVRQRLPGETKKDAKRRKKAERKALKRAGG
jgi:hypothetical protein